MAELLGDINAEPKPGTAFKHIVEEHAFFDELELDQIYVNDLNALKETWNPKWAESGIWPLISPYLLYLMDEISHLQDSVRKTTELLATVPDALPTHDDSQDGFDPLQMPESLEKPFSDYQRHHSIISTTTSITELKAWRQKVPSTTSASPSTLEKTEPRILPENERAYRRAVVAQQQVVEPAIRWYKNTLPDIMERHQQRAEDIKSFLVQLYLDHNELRLNLVCSSSTALRAATSFLSTAFISPHHTEVGYESMHVMLQKAQYRNYILGGVVARPLVGVNDGETIRLIKLFLELGGLVAYQTFSEEPWMTTIFDLELKAIEEDIFTVLKSYTAAQMAHLSMCVFHSDEPLIHVPRDKVGQNDYSVSRSKLMTSMQEMVPVERQKVLALIVRLVDYFRPTFLKENVLNVVADRLAHNVLAAGIIESIWRKWDIENDCPLPESVERIWRERARKSEIVSKRTGRAYYAPLSSLSS